MKVPVAVCLAVILTLAASLPASAQAQQAPAGTRRPHVYASAWTLDATYADSSETINVQPFELSTLTDAPATEHFDKTAPGVGLGGGIAFPEAHVAVFTDYLHVGDVVRTGTSRASPVTVNDRAVATLNRTVDIGANLQFEINRRVVLTGGGGISFWQLHETTELKIERDNVATPLADDKTSHTYTGEGPFWNGGVQFNLIPQAGLLVEYRGRKLTDKGQHIDAAYHEVLLGAVLRLRKDW